mgnify:CR=1 FL=1
MCTSRNICVIAMVLLASCVWLLTAIRFRPFTAAPLSSAPDRRFLSEPYPGRAEFLHRLTTSLTIGGGQIK